MPTEMSYLDLLNKLHADVKSDIGIPKHRKEIILELISYLMVKLFKYSA